MSLPKPLTEKWLQDEVVRILELNSPLSRFIKSAHLRSAGMGSGTFTWPVEATSTGERDQDEQQAPNPRTAETPDQPPGAAR